ncbi:hypothetical protein DK843_17995 [Chromobacterium phragmitis]|uniref:Uncharacterized protein n=1 Tax=Chromobacterium phragmitis TaxID=2202141 RepID=A0A344UL84_9NEIS|nr:hypothetical protein DK843_17995 [Chromobacterium phragmitis]
MPGMADRPAVSARRFHSAAVCLLTDGNANATRIVAGRRHASSRSQALKGVGDTAFAALPQHGAVRIDLVNHGLAALLAATLRLRGRRFGS